MSTPIADAGFVEVAVTGGRIRGHGDGTVASFLGIPYGAPTGGAHRFRLPQPVAPWPGVRDALKVGRACPQIPLTDSLPMRPDVEAALNLEASVSDGCADRENMGEDCLNLNLWAPASTNAETKLPVMVWLHGGAWTSGSGNLKRTEGYNFAKRGDVVSVAVNHRLGALGFLHLGGVSNDPSVAAAGNNGMLDIVEALKWVRHNIALFGGDPERVTIFGYSGGGFKVSTLMGMPAANGLFHRAIIQSGFLEGGDATVATSVARRFLEAVGIEPSNIDALRALPVEQIVRTQQEMGGVYAGFSAVIDGVTLPAPVSASIRAGATGQVPLILGYTREEASLFVCHTPVYGHLTWDNMPAALQDACGERATEALAIYRQARPDATPTRLWTAILSDHLFGMHGMNLLEAHTADSARRTWNYVSIWTSSVLPDLFSGHGIEEVLYFNNSANSPATRDTTDGADLGRRLSDAWVAFARDGDPNTALLPQWPQYSLSERATLIIDTTCKIRRDPFAAERAFWSARNPPSEPAGA